MNNETPQMTNQVVTLTANTIAKVKSLMASDPGAKGKNLRVFMEAGGCSGYQYGFSFDDKKQGDMEASFDGITVLVDSQSAEFLKGSVIDYKEDFAGDPCSLTQSPSHRKSLQFGIKSCRGVEHPQCNAGNP